MKGFGVHVGINRLDEEAYLGWQGKLNACENDAKFMERISWKQGFTDSTLLLSSNATWHNLKTTMERLSHLLEPQDLLLLTFSGHGAQLKAQFDMSEGDGLDEAWCLYDRIIRDNQLFDLWKSFKDGVRIFVVSDSCHSGDILKARNLIPNSIQETPTITDQIGCHLRLFAACAEHERTKDGRYLSAFTDALKATLNETPELNHQDFFKEMTNRLEFGTTPCHLILGTDDHAWDQTPPFNLL